jgi:hypothetical protein
MSSSHSSAPLPSVILSTPASPESLGSAEWEQDIPEHLLNEIKSGRCIAFVGAGFSIPAGLPTWTQLLERVLDAEEKDLNIKLEEDLKLEIRGLIKKATGESLDQAAQMVRSFLFDNIISIKQLFMFNVTCSYS